MQCNHLAILLMLEPDVDEHGAHRLRVIDRPQQQVEKLAFVDSPVVAQLVRLRYSYLVVELQTNLLLLLDLGHDAHHVVADSLGPSDYHIHF